MRIGTLCFLATASLLINIAVSAQAQPQLATGSIGSFGITPATLAEVVVESSFQLTVEPGTATVEISNPDEDDPPTDPRAIGIFSGGNVPAGTSLQDPVDPNAQFAGGVGMAAGVCLATGFLMDDEPSAPSVPPQLAVGVEGANNGFPIDLLGPGGVPVPNHEGEVSKLLQASAFGDVDFRTVHSNLPADGGDPAVLTFNVQLTSPGFLRVSFVFGSDEYPFWIDDDFNDTIVILVKGSHVPANSPGENLAMFMRSGARENFSLHALEECPPLFRKNNMSPAAVNAFPNTVHDIPGAPYYDHDFGGFSKVLTRETARPLAPGTYTIKFVYNQICDRRHFRPTG